MITIIDIIKNIKNKLSKNEALYLLLNLKQSVEYNTSTLKLSNVYKDLCILYGNSDPYYNNNYYTTLTDKLETDIIVTINDDSTNIFNINKDITVFELSNKIDLLINYAIDNQDKHIYIPELIGLNLTNIEISQAFEYKLFPSNIFIAYIYAKPSISKEYVYCDDTNDYIWNKGNSYLVLNRIKKTISEIKQYNFNSDVFEITEEDFRIQSEILIKEIYTEHAQ